MPTPLDQVFLQDILAQPEDDAPRLIYADWLEEQAADNPAARDRAEFIRVQCELAKREEDDSCHGLLQSREEVLLAAHEKAWLEPVRILGYRWAFRRGFLERGRFDTRKFLDNAERLFSLLPLRHIELLQIVQPNESPVSFQRISKLPCLARLRGLSLPWALDLEDFRAILTAPALAELQELELEGEYPDSALIRALAGLPAAPQLRRLTISAGSGNSSLSALMESCCLSNLEALKITGKDLTLEEVALLPSMLPRLQHLDISLSELPGGEPSSFKPAALSRLHGLQIFSRERSAADLAAFVSLCEGGQLRHLSLSCSRPCTDDPYAWLRIYPLPFLQRLELPNARIPTDGIQRLARSPLLNGLTLLNLRGNISSDAGARALAESLHLHSLRVLNLRFNGVGDTGARALADSPILGHLACLDLTANRLTDRGAEALARSAYLNNLVCLRLVRNDISTRGQELLRDRFGTGVFC